MANKIEMVKGDDEKRKITLTNTVTGLPIDLTNTKIWFSVKKNYSDTTYQFQRRNDLAGGDDTEILITDALNGEALLHVIPANTEDMIASNYVYDVQISHPTYGIKTPIKSTLFLKEHVTTEIS